MLRLAVPLLLCACATAQPPCDPAECAPCAPPNPYQVSADNPASGDENHRLSGAALDVFGPLVESFRKGPTPTSPQAVGLCSGAGEACTTPLGLVQEVLEPGVYVIVAELEFPELGPHTWDLQFVQQCFIESTDRLFGGVTRQVTRSQWSFEADRDRRIGRQLLHTVRSPSEDGHRACAWRLSWHTALGEQRIEGEYELPDERELPPPPIQVDDQTDDPPAEGAPAEAPVGEPVGDPIDERAPSDP